MRLDDKLSDYDKIDLLVIISFCLLYVYICIIIYLNSLPLCSSRPMFMYVLLGHMRYLLGMRISYFLLQFIDIPGIDDRYRYEVLGYWRSMHVDNQYFR